MKVIDKSDASPYMRYGRLKPGEVFRFTEPPLNGLRMVIGERSTGDMGARKYVVLSDGSCYIGNPDAHVECVPGAFVVGAE